MKPVEFAEQNTVMTPPADMTDEECTNLPVYRDGTWCISCWEPTGEELMEILQSKRIWLWVRGGGQPPVLLTSGSPFKEEEQA